MGINGGRAALVLIAAAALPVGAARAAPITAATQEASDSAQTISGAVALSFSEAEQRLRQTSGLERAAGYGVDAAQAQVAIAAGLNRPTVALDAQLVRYRKTFDISLDDALNRAQSDLTVALPGLIEDLPGLPGGVLDGIERRLEAALPELFASVPRDIRLEVDQTAFRPTVTALQPLYTGGAIAAARRAAGANLDLAEAQQREAVALGDLNLARAYFGQALAEQSAQIALETRDGFDLHLRNAERMQAQGVLSRSQVLQVQVARDGAQRQLERAVVEVANARADLARAIGLDGGVSVTTPLFVNRNAVGDVREFTDGAGSDNARTRQAAARRDLAEAGADLAASRLRPSVYAFGTYNLNPDSALPTEPDWAVGVGARYTLMSSVDRRQMLGAARAQSAAAAEAERQARDDARSLVTRAYNQVELARRQFLSLDSSLAAASENLRVQEIGSREGEATAAAVVDARTLLGVARLQRAAAAYEYDVSLAALLSAAGDGRTLSAYLQRNDRMDAQ